MPQEDPRRLLIRIVRVLRRLKIPYIITGGMAVLVWGRPRFTADIDIVVELQKEKIDLLAKKLISLDENSYLDKNSIKEAFNTFGEFNYIDGQTGIKVDFWILTNSSFDKSRLRRRKSKKILGENVYFSSPEDLILIKLKWHQQSGLSRELEDIESILKISKKKLDLKYLKNQAKELSVLSVLNRLIKDKSAMRKPTC